jgi:hypothetical protein
MGNNDEALCPEFGPGEDDADDDEDDSMSVCERCTRPGRARGPPGTDGALMICTGRGFGAVSLVVEDRAAG